jgi:site-specific DNA-methyltransferase (adenine-specific)
MLIENNIYLGDCLDLMTQIPDKSVDMILCDLPYGVSSAKWDIVIPFDKLWGNYNKIIKDNGVILLFGVEPFSSLLRTSNLKNYRYDWYWKKEKPSNFLFMNKMPGKEIECISVFYKHLPVYNPQKIERKDKGWKDPRAKGPLKVKSENSIELMKNIAKEAIPSVGYEADKLLPRQVLEFKKEKGKNKKFHPTQKPLALCEYLIKTYTNENNLILDNCMGSGTTCLAAKNLGRRWIGIEKNEDYFNKAKKRIFGEP